jgi:hypothetical protein
MLEEKLEALIKDININDNDIEKILINDNCLMLLDDYMKCYSYKMYVYSKLLQQKQKSRYKIMESEIVDFLSACEKNTLNPIFMKGIFLAAELYEKIEKRPSYDIDILIRMEDFEKYHIILKRLGYSLKYSFQNDADELKNALNTLKWQHLEYIKKHNQDTICIEVHTSIINSPVLFKDVSDDFINTAIQKDYFGMQPFVLDLEHNLIQLCVHFFKHLTLTYFQNILFNRGFSVNLSNIHDIALYQKKYGHTINVHKMLYISEKMASVKYILFIFRMVNKIYGELFDKYTIDIFKNKISFSKMNSVDSERSGFGKMIWLMDIFIDYCDEFMPRDFILGCFPDHFDLTNIVTDPSIIYTIAPSKPVVLKKTFKLSMNIGNRIKTAQIYLYMKASRKHLELQYCVDNKKCSFYDSYDVPCYTRDGVELIIIKKQQIIHKMFTLSKTNNKPSIVIYSNNNEKITDIDTTNINYNISIFKNSFKMKLIIPWDALNVDLLRDEIIPINIGGLVSNPDTKTQEKIFTIFKENDYFWNFNGIGAISLAKST